MRAGEESCGAVTVNKLTRTRYRFADRLIDYVGQRTTILGLWTYPTGNEVIRGFRPRHRDLNSKIGEPVDIPAYSGNTNMNRKTDERG